MFFKVTGKRTRLGGTKNEFNKVDKNREDFKIDMKEAELLNHLISIFSKRIEEIKG